MDTRSVDASACSHHMPGLITAVFLVARDMPLNFRFIFTPRHAHVFGMRGFNMVFPKKTKESQ